MAALLFFGWFLLLYNGLVTHRDQCSIVVDEEYPVETSNRIRLAFLANPHSRMLRKNPDWIPTAKETFGNRGLFLTPSSTEELREKIVTLRDLDPDLLFLCGGDGTLRESLSQLLHAYGTSPLPRIALLPTGTMNTVATSFGITGAPLTRLKKILERRNAAAPLATVRRHPLRVNGRTGFIFAIGGFANFIRYYSQPPSPSRGRALGMLIRVASSALFNGSLARDLFPEFTAHIWRDQKPFLRGEKYSTLSASAVEHIGFHFKPFFGAEGPEGSHCLFGLKGPLRHLLFHASTIWHGDPISDPNVIQVPARNTLIKLEQPLPFMMDGDILPDHREYSISSGPALEFVV